MRDHRIKELTRVLRLCLAVSLLLGAVNCTSTASMGKPQPAARTTPVVDDTTASDAHKIGNTPFAGDSCTPSLQFLDERNGWLACGGRLWQTQDGGRQWRYLYADSSRIVDFQFISLTTGWGIFGNAAYKTEDGGRNWLPAAPIVADKEGVIRTIRFLKDGKNGWAAGGVYRPVPPKVRRTARFKYSAENYTKALAGAILYTNDGGLSWQRQFVKSSLLGDNFTSLYISNKDEVWAFGDAGLYHLQGKTWKHADFESGSCPKQELFDTIGENNHDVYDETGIFFLDSGEGWLSFANGYVAKTTDGGRTWCDLVPARAIWPSPYDPRFFTKIYFTDSMNGLGFSPDGSLYRTKDGGGSWEPNKVKFKDVDFSDPDLIRGVTMEGVFALTYRTGT